jgi:hypothetical protein
MFINLVKNGEFVTMQGDEYEIICDFAFWQKWKIKG